MDNLNKSEFEKLYTENYKDVYWTCIALLKNEADAGDVTQNTFIKAYEAWDSLEDKSKASAWLKKIAANKCLDLLRSRKNLSFDERIENGEELDEQDMPGENFLPDEYALNKEKRELVMKIIRENLSDEQFSTILMFYFDEMSMEEIATALNIPVGTVKSRLGISRRRIKDGVEKYEKDNNVKLYSVIPLLAFWFREYVKAMSVNVPKMSAVVPAAASGAAASASVLASGEAASGAAAASGVTGASGAASASVAAKGLAAKILICVGAVAVAGAVVTAVVLGTHNEDKKEKNADETTTSITAVDTDGAATGRGDNGDSAGTVESRLNTSLTNQFGILESDKYKDKMFVYEEVYGIYEADYTCPYECDMDAIGIEICRKMVELSNYDENIVFPSDEAVRDSILYKEYIPKLYAETEWRISTDGNNVIISYHPVCYDSCLNIYALDRAMLDTDGSTAAMDKYSQPDEFANAAQYLIDEYRDYPGCGVVNYSENARQAMIYPIENGFISQANYEDLIRRLVGLKDGAPAVNASELEMSKNDTGVSAPEPDNVGEIENYIPGGIVDFDNVILYIDGNEFKLGEATCRDFYDAGYMESVEGNLNQIPSEESFQKYATVSGDNSGLRLCFGNTSGRDMQTGDYVFTGFEYNYGEGDEHMVSTNFSEVDDLEAWINDFREHNPGEDAYYYISELSSDGYYSIEGEHYDFDDAGNVLSGTSFIISVSAEGVKAVNICRE